MNMLLISYITLPEDGFLTIFIYKAYRLFSLDATTRFFNRKHESAPSTKNILICHENFCIYELKVS